MNKKIIIRIVLVGLVVLFSVGVGIYSFLHLSDRQKSVETNLFSLVPQSSLVVLETSNLSRLIQDMERTSFQHEIAGLHLSDLLSLMKNNIDLLTENTAHGLSTQMNQMLVSFHQPGTLRDQVLYCKLGQGDEKLIENIIKKNSSQTFPPKTFLYKGEEIRIYPLGNNDFLACYFHPGFFVVSYQKKLIEEVIDAHTQEQSLMQDPIFAQFVKDKKTYSPASLYLKTKHVELGKPNGSKGYSTRLSHWNEFDIKTNRDAIYLSGVCLDTDSCPTFENILKLQQQIEIVDGKTLPAFTRFFYQMALSDFPSMLSYSTQGKYPKKQSRDLQEKNDSTLYEFLIENSANELCYLMFQEADSASLPLHKVLRIKLKEMTEAKIQFRKRGFRDYGKQTFLLPSNTFFAQFTGNPDYQSDTYGSFHDGNLLVSSDEESIGSYIRQIEKGQVIEGNPLYEECISSLAPESGYLVYADMGKTFQYPESYNRLIPRFFFQYPDFFAKFILTVQYTSANNKVYPYVILTYKGEV